jgi:hypothetical protein
MVFLNSGDGGVEDLRRPDDRLVQSVDGLKTAPPLPHVGLSELIRDRLRRVSAHRLIERQIPDVGAGDAAVVADQLHQRLGVPVGIEDALDDHVETAIQQMPSHQVEQRDRVSASILAGSQDLAAKHVLTQDGDRSSRLCCADRRCDGRLPRPTAAPESDQPSETRPNDGFVSCTRHRSILMDGDRRRARRRFAS